MRSRPARLIPLTVSISLVLFTVSTLTGCGVLFVPVARKLPAKELRTVVVLDRETGKPIEDARVTLRFWRVDNYKIFSFWGYSPDSASKVDAEDGAVADEQRAAYMGEGVYQLRPQVRWGTVQVLFPLGIPLGWCIYRVWEGTVVVDTPNNGRAWFDSGVTEMKGGLGRPTLYCADGQRREPPPEAPVPLVTFLKERTIVWMPRSGEPHGQ